MKNLFTIITVFIFTAGSIFAGGFQINDQSARSVGMGFSTIANIQDPSALFYNPAALINIPSDLAISLGVSYIMPASNFTGITTLNQQNTIKTETWNFPIPNFYAAWKTPLDGLTLAAGVFVPFGLGSKWDENWVGRFTALETYLQTIEINPVLTYQLPIKDLPIAISAGFGYVMGDVSLKKKLDNFTPEPLLKLTGDGTGTTFNFGLYVQPLPEMKIGASYRHNIEINYDGKVTYENIAGLEPLFKEGDGKTKINFPNDFRFGIAYNLMKDLWVEAGLSYVGWSSYDTLSLELSKAPGTPTLAYTSNQPRNYKDAIGYKLGCEYQMYKNFTLRLGFYYDPLAVGEDDIEPVLPEGNRLGGALGLGYKICDHFSLDVGYLGIYGFQAEVKNNPNDFNGLYNTGANIISLSINYNY